MQALADVVPHGLVELADFVRFGERLAHLRAKRVVRLAGVAPDAKDGEPVVDEMLVQQLVDRRQQLAASQIAERAEDDHGARVGLRTLLVVRRRLPGGRAGMTGG